MTNPDQPSSPLTLTLVEKLYVVHNINTLVLEKLDLAESNYSTWSYFFKDHYSNFVDSIVKSWFFLTLSSTLRKRLIKANPKIAKDAWDTIEAIFQDNKRTRVVALKGELCMIQMGDQTADEYFSNIDSIVTLLNDLGSDVSQDDVVTYAINGLSDKYGSLAKIIARKEPFSNLSTVRSMVFTEEMRIRNKSPSLSVRTNSGAPQVLLTETPHRVQDTHTNKEHDNRNNNKTERTKHIEIDIHFVRDLVTTGHIRVLHVPYRYQYADIFTKGLPTALFDEFHDSLSVRSSPAQTTGGC
ncbi:hybrid signal transduction histidine kinase M [Tanacetum coccineum]